MTDDRARRTDHQAGAREALPVLMEASDEDLRLLRRSLALILESIDAHVLDTSDTERAYLAGALATLDQQGVTKS